MPYDEDIIDRENYYKPIPHGETVCVKTRLEIDNIKMQYSGYQYVKEYFDRMYSMDGCRFSLPKSQYIDDVEFETDSYYIRMFSMFLKSATENENDIWTVEYSIDYYHTEFK